MNKAKFLNAIKFNNQKEVQDYIEIAKEYYDIAVITAAEYGNLNALELLHKNGANIYTRDNDPIKIASKNGHIDIVRYLLEQKADATAGDFCAIRLAAEFNKPKILELFNQKIDLTQIKEQLLFICARYGNIETAEFLLQNKTNIKAQNNHALLISLKYNKQEMVKFLIKNGADIHVNNEYPLFQMLDHKNYNIIKFLIENGADIKIMDNAALHTSINNQTNDITKLLIQTGADIYTDNGVLIIILQQQKNNEILEFLKEEGIYSQPKKITITEFIEKIKENLLILRNNFQTRQEYKQHMKIKKQ